MFSTARTIAFDVLLLVESGGYASDLLFIRSAALDSRDAGLASEIVLGVLRFQSQLDFLIDFYSGKKARLDMEVRIALRMAIYQLRYLERVPAHAAIHESVELIKRARKRSAAGSPMPCCEKSTGNRLLGQAGRSIGISICFTHQFPSISG